jgi:hypothetical protein
MCFTEKLKLAKSNMKMGNHRKNSKLDAGELRTVFKQMQKSEIQVHKTLRLIRINFSEVAAV